MKIAAKNVAPPLKPLGFQMQVGLNDVTFGARIATTTCLFERVGACTSEGGMKRLSYRFPCRWCNIRISSFTDSSSETDGRRCAQIARMVTSVGDYIALMKPRVRLTDITAVDQKSGLAGFAICHALFGNLPLGN
jgi:hypothetical protein